MLVTDEHHHRARQFPNARQAHTSGGNQLKIGRTCLLEGTSNF